MEGGLARHVHTAPPQLTDPEVLSEVPSLTGDGDGRDPRDGFNDAGQGRAHDGADDPRLPRASEGSVHARRRPRQSGILRWDDGGGGGYDACFADEQVVHIDDEEARQPRRSVFAWSVAASEEYEYEHESEDDHEGREREWERERHTRPPLSRPGGRRGDGGDVGGDDDGDVAPSALPRFSTAKRRPRVSFSANVPDDDAHHERPRRRLSVPRLSTASTTRGDDGEAGVYARAPRVSVAATLGSNRAVGGGAAAEYRVRRRDARASTTSSRRSKKPTFSLAYKPPESVHGRGSIGIPESTIEGAMSTQYTLSDQWDASSSSADDVSVLKGASDEDGVEEGHAGGGEGDESEGGGGEGDKVAEKREALARRKRREAALVEAVPDPKDADDDAHVVTRIEWSYQNLDRVPPGLKDKMRLHLRSLDVSHNRLLKLPSNLALFDCLVELDASHNRLERVPPALGRCKKLEVLKLHDNELRKLGMWVTELTALKRLHVYNNPLVDPPTEVADLGVDHVREYLRALKVIAGWNPDDKTEFNRHSGETKGLEIRHVLFKSSFFARFTELTRVDVSGARLPSLPTTLVTCHGLVELNADENALTALPDLRACAKLARLSASRCRLTKLPGWVGGCGRLVELDVSSNRIVGPLPSLRACRALKTLRLDRNAIRELPRLPSGLTRLFATGNNLDEISHLTDAVDLTELDLERNKVPGLPDDFADLHRLEVINVCKNLIRTLDVPGMPRRAPKLRVFKFSHNPLGDIPWWITDVQKSALEEAFLTEVGVIWELRQMADYLRQLDLSSRAMLHSPALYPHFVNLTNLKLSSNSLAFLPASLSDLVGMRYLHLDENFITFLPDLSRMTRLKDLRVQGNRLAILTPSIRNLAELESLYVGRNPLSELPDLTACVALKTLWMTNCQFTSLPVHIAEIPKLANFYAEGNPLVFPDPALYEKGGNDALLQHMRNIVEHAKEQAELKRFREEKAEEKKAREAARAVARLERQKKQKKRPDSRAPRVSHPPPRRTSVSSSDGSGVDDGDGVFLQRWHRYSSGGSSASSSRRGSCSDGSDDKDKDSGGAGTSGLGRILWRRVRRMVIDEKHEREAADKSGALDNDMFLRAKELKTSIRVVNAKEELAHIESDVQLAASLASDADERLVALVQEITVLREKMAKQRAIMAEYMSINEDYLKEMQVKLRALKKELRAAVAEKEEADKSVGVHRRRAEEKAAEVASLEAEAEDIAQQQRESAEAKLMEKMRQRRDEVEAIRRNAEEGAVAMEKALEESQMSLADRSALAREGLHGQADREREHRDRMGAKAAMLGVHQGTGMAKGTDSEVQEATKAWGRLRINQSLGLFGKTMRGSRASITSAGQGDAGDDQGL